MQLSNPPWSLMSAEYGLETHSRGTFRVISPLRGGFLRSMSKGVKQGAGAPVVGVRVVCFVVQKRAGLPKGARFFVCATRPRRARRSAYRRVAGGRGPGMLHWPLLLWPQQ